MNTHYDKIREQTKLTQSRAVVQVKIDYVPDTKQPCGTYINKEES